MIRTDFRHLIYLTWCLAVIAAANQAFKMFLNKSQKIIDDETAKLFEQHLAKRQQPRRG